MSLHIPSIIYTALVLLAIVNLVIALHALGYTRTSAPTTIYASKTEGDLLCVRAATVLSPLRLLGRNDTVNVRGQIPKIIHQSWADENLPVLFKKWSDGLRLHHPDWEWVLWTDADNAELVARRHPHLNESYWALRNNIQRADFARNLYMWDFGGVYSDLDVESLRPLDSLFTPSSSSPPEALAYVGTMDTSPRARQDSIPNAFMASTPHHPFWLLPISQILHHFSADPTGHIAQGHADSNADTAEHTTGPGALYRSVQAYQQWQSSATRLDHDLASSDLTHSGVKAYTPVTSHDVILLDPGIIYPFSWFESRSSEVYRRCRASKEGSATFDPVLCQVACKAYERGARMITYWSHTWSQNGNSKDLSIVGH